MMMQRLCCAVVLLCSGWSLAQQDNPWGFIDSLPSDLDLVAVVDNPARAMLSAEGQASRGFIGSMGLFGKTRQAWGSMAELLGTNADGVIEQLLSERVVIVVDSLIEREVNPFLMVNKADANWVLMGEVSGGKDAFGALRKRLKPIPREIVNGVAVYGIEQGRYALVMLNPKEGEDGRVMLCPKGGRALLERVLGSIQKQDELQLHAQPTPSWRGQDDWSIALRVRVDSWTQLLDERDAGKSKHVRLLMGKSDGGVAVELAMPFDGEQFSGAAPVGILDALDDDVVGAMASAGIFQLVLDDQEGLSILLKGNELPKSGSVLEPAGVLMMLDRDDLRLIQNGVESMGMTMLSIFDVGAVDASSMDAAIEPMVFRDPTNFQGVSAQASGSYQGLFPKAVRSHEISDEFGEVSNVSWLTSERSESSDLIFSFGDQDTETSKRVRSVSELVASLDAIGGGVVQSAVVLKGFAKINALAESFGASAWMGTDATIEDMGTVRWELLQEVGALRGRVMIEIGRD
jgi:hypothetical protein